MIRSILGISVSILISIAVGCSEIQKVEGDAASVTTVLSAWQKATPAGGYSAPFGDIVYGNEKFVAVGRGEIQVSSDGISWASVAPANGYTDDFFAIVYEQNQFVAVGEMGEIQTSPDGLVWTHRNSDNGFNQNFAAVVSNGSSFVIAGANGEIQSSPDAINWTSQTVGGGFAGTFWHGSFGNSLFLLTGDNGEIQTSPDGISWTSQKIVDYNNTLFGSFFYNGVFHAVGAGLDKPYVRTGNGNFIWQEFEPDSEMPFAQKTSLTIGEGHLVMVGAGGRIFDSVDGGDTWLTMESDNYTNVYWGVAYGAGRFVAVGRLAEIQYSVVQ